MRSRHTTYTLLAALGLALFSFGFYALSTPPVNAPSQPGWCISTLRNGVVVSKAEYHQLPTDTAELPPIADAGGPYTLLIEPGTTAAIGEGWFAAADRGVVEFLLLLPPATLLVCIFRNVVGLDSFGAFAPALLGLAFREADSLLGVFVVLTILTAGWWLRRGIDVFHLLQTPRTAVLLSCIVVLLLAVLSSLRGHGPRAITLFPLVILTGMVERLWSLDEEGGALSSLGVLASTLLMAAAVWAMAAITPFRVWLCQHPETLGLVMAAQLLLGRYTGLRLLELYRFRSLAANADSDTPPQPPPIWRMARRPRRRFAWEP